MALRLQLPPCPLSRYRLHDARSVLPSPSHSSWRPPRRGSRRAVTRLHGRVLPDANRAQLHLAVRDARRRLARSASVATGGAGAAPVRSAAIRSMASELVHPRNTRARPLDLRAYLLGEQRRGRPPPLRPLGRALAALRGLERHGLGVSKSIGARRAISTGGGVTGGVGFFERRDMTRRDSDRRRCVEWRSLEAQKAPPLMTLAHCAVMGLRERGLRGRLRAVAGGCAAAAVGGTAILQ